MEVADFKSDACPVGILEHFEIFALPWQPFELKKISYENIFSCITLLLSNENHSFLHILFLDAWPSKILKNVRCHSNCLVTMVTDLMKINKF